MSAVASSSAPLMLAGAQATLQPEEPGQALARAEQAAKSRRIGEAAGICRDVLKTHPDHPGALGLLGTLASTEGDLDQAVTLLERAVAVQPGNGVWHANLSELYRLVYRGEDALKAAMTALQIGPATAFHHVLLGKIHVDRSEPELALTHFLAALTLDPDDASAHLGMGQILLARGDFHSGWIEYEWRNKLEQAKGMIPGMRAPVWNGMALPKGRILLIGDQGHGDVLQFVRYVPMVVQRCAEVVVACSQDLEPLIRQVPGIARCFHDWQECPGFTAYALMSSLPWAFGTQPSTIPAKVPYLAPDAAKVDAWRSRLGASLAGDHLRVGLFWAGRPTHPNDRRRSIALSQLLPLAALEGVSFVALQKDVPRQDVATFDRFPHFLDLSAQLTDFAETAAIIANLDLLITVDSAVAHLAGGMDKPVWVLLPRPSDWRWMLERADSPWYSSLRLFRQPTPGAWQSVIATVADQLRQMVADRAGGHGRNGAATWNFAPPS